MARFFPPRPGVLMLVLLACISVGCASTPTHRLLRLDVGMSEDEVLASLGPPDAVRLGGIRTGAEKPVEIWEYHMYDQAADRGLSAIFGIGRANINYWLYFEEGALYRWGPAGESKPPLRVK